MDGLFSLIWVIFIVVTLVNAVSGKNKKQQPKRGGVPPLTAQPVAKPAQPEKPMDFQEFRDRIASDIQARQARQAPSQPQKSAPAPVAAPKVHSHLAPDCDLDEPSGSMDFTSTEGLDPCHDDELPGRLTPRPSAPVMQEQPGLALEWTSDALVRSVIMQEVLTRPSQRQRR